MHDVPGVPCGSVRHSATNINLIHVQVRRQFLRTLKSRERFQAGLYLFGIRLHEFLKQGDACSTQPPVRAEPLGDRMTCGITRRVSSGLVLIESHVCHSVFDPMSRRGHEAAPYPPPPGVSITNTSPGFISALSVPE